MICAIDQIKNSGEEAFYQPLERYLDNSHVVYWNREVYGREFDYCVLIPEVGIAVIEVKGWQEATVIGVPQGEYISIHTEHGEEHSNPRAQARGYRFAVFNNIKNKLGKQPLVFHMVCYPFISTNFFKSKHMDLISESQLTFTKDDLISKESFLDKLDKAIAFSRSWGTHAFTPLLMKQVRSLFEPCVDFEEEIINPLSICKAKHLHLIPNYSIATYIPASEQNWKILIDELAAAYSNGCRIYSIVGTQEMLDYVSEKTEIVLRAKGLKVSHKGDLEIGVLSNALTIDGTRLSIFNWQTVRVNDVNTLDLIDIPCFKVIDGDIDTISNTQIWLAKLDAYGAFNLSQFKVEHAKTDKNILVRAGAGTGKTYAMILRVALLCYAEDISPANLVDRILMITFTNDAANNMKSRLKSCFQNYYLLTGIGDYLEMMAQVDRMQISTIHSFARRIIEKLGTAAGYGQGLQITSGLFGRRLIIEETLESYVREQTAINPQFLNELGLPVYELRKKLLDFVGRLENKSIDISEVKPEQFGTANENEPLHRLLVAVLGETERSFDRQLIEENRVFLGRLMAVLSRLVTEYPERLQEELVFGARYMFIDEFQDTDDVQIAVLKEICKHVGYLMFVVGDIKQCIYRFRGAEEKAFNHLKVEEAPKYWEQFSLSKNYRTDKDLLKLYQNVFSYWGSPAKGLLTYDPQVDALISNLSLNDNAASDETYYHVISVTSESSRLPEVFNEIRRYTNVINEQLSNGKYLSNEERTIAILVRENWQADEIVKYGRDNGFPTIQSNIGGELYQSVPALEMCALLQALLNSEPEQLSHLLESNFFGIIPDRHTMYELKPDFTSKDKSRDSQVKYLISLIDSMLSQTVSQGGYQSWSNVLHELRISPVLQILRGLYNQLRPWVRFGEQYYNMSSYYRMNVDLLFEKILQGCRLDNLTFHRLTSFIQTNIVTGRAEECRWPIQGGKEIRILCTTVHKSKGLEYGYVILPFASFAIDKPKRTGMDIMVGTNGNIGYSFKYAENQVLRNNFYDFAQEAAERMNEETRVLYVAMTRAIRAFSWIELQSSRSTSWQTLLMGGAR